MLTHAALTLYDSLRSTPDGMPAARCGWQNDGHGIAVAWERRFVDCPMCLLMLDGIPVVPVSEAHFMRTPRRPDYVPEGHIYVPPEFRPPRRRNRLGVLLLVVMALAAIITAVALIATWEDNVGTSPAPGPGPVLITPTTYGPPPVIIGK